MWIRCAPLSALGYAVTILLGTTASIQAAEPSYAPRIGIFEQCLAIHNRNLRPGTPVTIIRFNSEDDPVVSGNTPGRRVAAKIVLRTNAADKCPALVKERARTKDNFSIYTVSAEDRSSLEALEFGIGIVGLGTKDAEPIDIDGNGVADSFTVFSSAGGLIFEVWKDGPWEGEHLWEGYYDVGHAPEE